MISLIVIVERVRILGYFYTIVRIFAFTINHGFALCIALKMRESIEPTTTRLS
jgi:hypothetical protein